MAKTKKQLRLEALDAELESTTVTTEQGKFSMHELIYDIGVKSKIRYFNVVSKKNKKANRFYEAKKTFDWGLIFKNGCEIRGVKAYIFNHTICDNPIIEKRERIPSFKSVSATPIPFTE